MGIVILAGGWWVISARKWFKGPIRTVEGPTMSQGLDEKNSDI
jgi:hypothetical protein